MQELVATCPECPELLRKRRSRRIYGTLLGVICLVVIACIIVNRTFGAVASDELMTVIVNIDDRSREIGVEVFQPNDGNQSMRPAVVFLHGVEGAERYRGPHTQTCRWIADHGYRVFYVHYFDVGDYADLWLLRSDGSLDRAAIDAHCRKDAARWSSAVLQVVREVSHRTDVDENRIAIDGISLGGFIALEVADEAQRDPAAPDIRAVVANWAAQFELTECRPGFPPTLHLHGEHDEVVPLSEAQQSVDEIRSAGGQAELLIIPGAAHVARSRHSEERTLSFLANHLKPPATVAIPFSPIADIDAFVWRELGGNN